MAMTNDLPTLRDARDFLLRLGFRRASGEQLRHVYGHGPTHTVIALPDRADSDPLQTIDLLSLRRRLVKRGLVDEDSFAAFFERRDGGERRAAA